MTKSKWLDIMQFLYIDIVVYQLFICVILCWLSETKSLVCCYESADSDSTAQNIQVCAQYMCMQNISSSTCLLNIWV